MKLLLVLLCTGFGLVAFGADTAAQQRLSSPATGVVAPTEIEWGALRPYRLRLGETTLDEVRVRLAGRFRTMTEAAAPPGIPGGRVIDLGASARSSEPSESMALATLLLFDAAQKLVGFRVSYGHLGDAPTLQNIYAQRLAVLERRFTLQGVERSNQWGDATVRPVTFNAAGMRGTLIPDPRHLVETHVSEAFAAQLGMKAPPAAIAAGQVGAPVAGNPLLGIWSSAAPAGSDTSDASVSGALAAMMTSTACSAVNGLRFDVNTIVRKDGRREPVRYSRNGARWGVEGLDPNALISWQFEVTGAGRMRLVHPPLNCEMARAR